MKHKDKLTAGERKALKAVPNMAEFARTHDIPYRTLWRVAACGTARRGTIALIRAALRAA